jgi:hypothetical protein
MTTYHLAQINIGRILAPIGDPLMADFVSQLPPINAIADTSPGFVWRLQTESGDATSIRVYEDEMVAINMSVWKNVETLREYVYKSAHSGSCVIASAGSRNLKVRIMQCGGSRPGISQLQKKARHGWII